MVTSQCNASSPDGVLLGSDSQKSAITVTPSKKAQTLPIRKLLIILACVFLPAIAGIAVWKYISDPPKPWLVRWRVARYLKKQSGRSDFKIEFPFPSPTQMATALPKEGDGVEIVLKGK